MKTRRSWLPSLTAGLVALAVLVVPAIAAELMGTVKSVDADGMKMMVIEKGTEKEVEVTIKSSTKIENPKGKMMELAKIKKDQRVEVTHEGGVASKVVVKGAPKKDNP